jgi:ATP adenylyltransferase
MKPKKGCIFCSAFKEKRDKKNWIILRSKHSFAILNAFPYNNGHVMVIINRHLSLLEQLNDAELMDINKTAIRVIKLLRKVLRPSGFNVGINLGRVSGAGIDKHLHIHIVPRWLGDTNFMPVACGTKIISQSLNELYSKIKQA